MKISFAVIDKLIDMCCSKNDINFIIHVAQYQFEDGMIYNLSYKNVYSQLGITNKSYYDILNRLQSKGIIQVSDTDKYGYRNIKILDNDFSDKNFSHYININRPFLHSDEFYKMKATTKYVLLKLLKQNRDNENEKSFTEKTIAKYANIDPKNKRLVKKIVEALKDFTYKKDNVLEVKTEAGITSKCLHKFKLILNTRRRKENKRPQWELETRQNFMFKSFCNKHHITYVQKDIDDLIQMDNQYKDYSSLYINKVKELLLQYRDKIREEGNIGFVCAALRTIVDPIIQNISLRTSYTENYKPLF